MIHDNENKLVSIYLIVLMVVQLRIDINNNVNDLIFESLPLKDLRTNPKYIFGFKFNELTKEKENIPDLITKLFTKNIKQLQESELIKPISSMANYFYDFIPYSEDKDKMTISIIEMMIEKGSKPTVVSEDTYPFWRYHKKIFDNIVINTDSYNKMRQLLLKE